MNKDMDNIEFNAALHLATNKQLVDELKTRGSAGVLTFIPTEPDGDNDYRYFEWGHSVLIRGLTQSIQDQIDIDKISYGEEYWEDDDNNNEEL